METPDLQTKYQKLATEFSKLRAQVSVLKKGVIDEQTKNRELKDELQGSDQAMRKIEQEMDSVLFRNKQLEKRVEFLQNELLAKSQLNKGGRNRTSNHQQHETNSSNNSSSAPVFDDELLAKIEENIDLQKKISELEDIHKNEIIDLKRQMENTIRAASPSKIHQEQMDALEAEKLALTYSIQNNFDEIEAYKEQVNQLVDKIRILSTSTTTTEPDAKQSHSEIIIPKSQNEEESFQVDSETQVNEITSPDELISSDNRSLIEKLTTSEQQREHWILEYQLLKMKYSKIFMKLEDAREILKSFGKEDLISGELTPSAENVQSFTSMVGKIEVISDDPNSWDKKLIKDYLTNRINELVGLLQLADSKAISFYSECKSLASHLKISSEKRKELEFQLATLMSRNEKLQEELQVTTDNYEVQLRTMSEHLANMNEKLAIQKDIIDELRFELNSKAGSSGKKK